MTYAISQDRKRRGNGFSADENPTLYRAARAKSGREARENFFPKLTI
jgi:hypothetical protein